MEKAPISIFSLPDEVVILILKRTSYADCNSFRRTCKRYNDLLKYSHSLWRVIFQKTVGKIVYNMTASHSTGDWFSDLRQYLSLRDSLINIIVDMSPKHFCEYSRDIALENVKEVFAISLSNNTNFYCTVSILQDFIQTAIKKVNSMKTKKPYTLTEIHYGKMIVRYLIHIVFTLKWVHHYATNTLSPEIVLNFFIQWLDPVHMHRDEDISDLIKGMVRDVDEILIRPNDTGRLPGVEVQNACASGVYTERQVLTAISTYMYKQRRMVFMTACNQDTLDIVKTIKSNSGHGASLGAIFQAIARGFGITTCNLIAFPNHLYLEWRASNRHSREIMQFSLDTGELRTSGRCPFSANTNRVNYKYSAELFLQHVAANYLRHMGDFTGWHTDNAVHLLDFIINNGSSEYCNYIVYLRGLDYAKLSLPFNIEYLHEDHIAIVHALLHLNTPTPTQYRDLKGQLLHPSTVKYSVGMVCFHKIYDYVCVIRGWDLQCAPEYRGRPEAGPMEHGTEQPFYYITAVDQSERYVAQENLILVTKPSRIYHIEDAISKEFTHFNGFFYELNDEKRALYPEDMAIGKMYAAKSFTHIYPDEVRRY